MDSWIPIQGGELVALGDDFFCVKRLAAVMLSAMGVAGTVAVGQDYFTDGFFTRGETTRDYVGRGGQYEPFSIPMRQWYVVPRTTLSASYADNYYGNEVDGDAVYTVDLVPGCMLMYGLEDHNYAYADVGAILPLSEDDPDAADRESFLIKLGARYGTGRTQANSGYSFRQVEGLSSLVGERVVEQTHLASMGLDHHLTSRSGLGVSGRFEAHSYDDDGYLAYNRAYAALHLSHVLTPKSDMYLRLGVGTDMPEDSELGLYGDATYYDLSLGMRGSLTPKTSVHGGVGFRERTYDDETIDDVSGIVGEMGCETTPFGFSTFSIDYIGDIRPDITRNGDATLDRRINVAVNRRLFSERLRGGASVQFGNVEYHSRGASENDEYWGYVLGLDWWALGDLSCGIDYSYTERESGARSTYESQRIMARASWNY
jgi:hypothetical protein